MLSGGPGNDELHGDSDHDLLRGGDGNDQLYGGLGNDTLRGDSGSNVLNGGPGDDTIIPGANSLDLVLIGQGNDLIDLSERDPGSGFLSIVPDHRAESAFFLIDGDANFGSYFISNQWQPIPEPYYQTSGRGEIVNLNNALPLGDGIFYGGIELAGTMGDDTFLVDTGEDGWLSVRPGLGADTIQIEDNPGTVRLNYNDQEDGIYANLRFGLVVDGGPGFVTDRITGSGHVKELAATASDDRIYGSNADEIFILLGGDDFVHGRRGADTVRYSWQDFGAVEVDLRAKIATGTWKGDGFTHTLRSIENITGSRDGNDTIKGNGAANMFEGRGGRDKLIGRGGDDILLGGDGRDTLDGGAGNDVLEGGAGADRFLFKDGGGQDTILDFGAGADQINLKGVSTVLSFTDIQNVSSEFTDSEGTHTVLDFGSGNTLTLLNITEAEVDGDAGLFIFNELIG